MISKKMFSRGSSIIATLGLVVVCLIGTSITSASAADGSQFDAGNIIDDALFYDGQAMSPVDIQNFLNQMVGTCRAGYTCLKDYHQDSTTKATESGKCTQYDGRANESAADIIYRVGSACGISQKVLLVLLQKEQGLITDTWPTSDQYRKATGYACPDTAACDATFNGFFNQVYMAALQYKRYKANPSGYNFIAGRANNIGFNPNGGCGSSSVFIQNAATAGLYDYTPYQPNAAALANLYGTGDGCSAYGNRNFWRIYTDWFGSTRVSSLMRTVANGTVYLMGDGVKYPITNQATLAAFSSFGPISYVSQSYLDSYASGQPASRIIRDSSGSIFFTDSGIKLPFASCGLVSDYGGSCSTSGYLQLTTQQTAKLFTGPFVTPLLGTTAGARFLVSGGAAREVLDNASLAAIGQSGPMNVLSESATVGLAAGSPIVRDSVVVFSRNGSGYLLAGSKRYALTGTDAFSLGISNSSTAAGRLYDWSVAQIVDGGRFSGFVNTAGVTYAATTSGLASTGSTPLIGASAAVPVSQAFVQSFTSAPSLAPASFIKSVSNGTVYVIMPTDIRPIASWEALVALTPTGQAPLIQTVSDVATANMTLGNVALTSGQLYRDSNNATVYLINGVTTKIAFSSFVFPSALGATEFSFTTPERLNAYPTDPTLLTFGVQCSGTNYAVAGGQLHAVSSQLLPNYPFGYVQLDQFSCAKLSIGGPATNLIRVASGTVYFVDGGQKHPIGSLARLAQLNTGQGWVQVDDAFADMIPTGSSA